MTEQEVEFEELVGKTITNFSYEDYELLIEIKEDGGRKFIMKHDQRCCEDVQLDEHSLTELKSILGHKIIVARKDTIKLDAVDDLSNEDLEYTFYTIRTYGGDCQLRWIGRSNGYYADVSFYEVLEKKDKSNSMGNGKAENNKRKHEFEAYLTETYLTKKLGDHQSLFVIEEFKTLFFTEEKLKIIERGGVVQSKWRVTMEEVEEDDATSI